MQKKKSEKTYFFVDESGDPYFYNRKGEFVVARKVEKVFANRHKKRANLFYDDLVSKLFQNQLHTSEENIIYFATRGNRARQVPLEDAIHTAIMTFENKWNTKIDSRAKIFPQRPEGEVCLQIVDYMNWAVQRAFVKRESRYLEFMESKVSLIADIYDFANYPHIFYNKKNPISVHKISPL